MSDDVKLTVGEAAEQIEAILSKLPSSEDRRAAMEEVDVCLHCWCMPYPKYGWHCWNDE